MQRIILLLFLVIFSQAALALYNVPLPSLPINQPVRLETFLKDSGQKSADETMSFSFLRSPEKEFLVVRDSISQKMENVNYTANLLVYYIVKNKRLSAYTQTTEISKEGRPFQSAQLQFDWDKMKLYFTLYDWEKNKKSVRTLPLTAKTFTQRGAIFYFQNLLQNKITEDNAQMFIPNGSIMNMHLNLSYVPETITIKNRKISCYKIEMHPEMGVFSGMAPTMYFWFQATPPFSFIRYDGLEKGPGSAQVIQQVVL